MVEYSANYQADHWCDKGHILLVLNGEFVLEFEDGGSETLGRGKRYSDAANTRAQRVVTNGGAKVFIVD